MSARYRFHMHPIVVGAQLVAISTFASAIVLDVPSLETSVFVSSVCLGIIIVAMISSPYLLDMGEPGVRIGTTPFRRSVILSDRDLLGGVRLAGLAGADDVARAIAAREIENGKGLVLVDGRGGEETRAAVVEAAARSGRTDELVVLDFGDEGRRGTHAMLSLEGLSEEAVCRVILGMDVGRREFHELVRAVLRTDPAETETFAYALISLSLHSRRESGSRHGIGIEWPSAAELVRASSDGSPVADSILAYLCGLPGYDPGRGEDQRRDLVDRVEGMRRHLDERLRIVMRYIEGPFLPVGNRVDLGFLVRAGRIVHLILPPDEDPRRDAVIGSILAEQAGRLAEKDEGTRIGSIVGIDLPERWSYLLEALRMRRWGLVRARCLDDETDGAVLISTRLEVAMPGVDARKLARLRPGRAVVIREGDRPVEFAIDKAAVGSSRGRSPMPPMLFVEGGMVR